MMEMEDHHQQQSEFLQALKALRAASKDIETNSDESDCNSPSMKALLELHTGSVDLFNDDPKLTTLSSLLSSLKSLASSLKHRPPSLLGRRRSNAGNHEISRIAGSIGSELQSWIDRQSIHTLISSLSCSDEEKSTLLIALQSRLSQGFDPSFQDLLLRSNVFSAVQSLLADPSSSKKVRDLSASATLAFVRFNKHVFVGEVLMGPTVRTLVSISSAASIRVLNGLISSIRSPLVDELHANGDIAKIIEMLSSEMDEIRVPAFDTVLEIGYYGRKEAVDAMLEGGLIEMLIELHLSPEIGGALIEMEGEDEGREAVKVGGVERERERRREEERRYLERHPFASCVSRFSIQLEVGEGLRQREKRAVKLEVLRRVREAVKESEADGATILAEVLWGPTVW